MTTRAAAWNAEVKPLQARPHATASGLLLAAIGAPFAIAESSFGGSPFALWVFLVSATLSVTLAAAGTIIPQRPRLGRWLSTISVLGMLALAVPELAESAFRSLTVLLLAGGSIAMLWNVAGPPFATAGAQRRPLLPARARGAAALGLTLWTFHVIRETNPTFSLVSTAVALVSALVFSCVWMARERGRHRLRASILLGALFLVLLVAALSWRDSRTLLNGGAALCAAALLIVPRDVPHRSESASLWEPLLGHPARALVGTFAVLSTVGTALLALPASSSSGHSIGFVDALFTATSAVCVTGLIVLDTPAAFSLTGQAVILLLIQVGGLGIMTFSTAAMWALGRRMSLRYEGTMADLLSSHDRRQVFATTRQILILTFAAEALGALLLSALFVWHGDTLASALWRGLFTSISAFCNAGFALQSDSLIPYQSSPLVLHVVATLIILGGISPLAVSIVPRLIARRGRPVPTQARLSLSATGVLLVVGFLLIAILEWNRSLAHLPLVDRLHNAWFQSVTLRTAGFNSIDIAAMQPATLVFSMVWMFIGGSPGGTAGGVKTTTVSILFLSIVDAVRGHWTLHVFGRRVPEQTRVKAAVIVSVAAAMIILGVVTLQLTQPIPTSLAAFEVVSALGTVGLSIGGTSLLDEVGRIIITTCMFSGRVGALTLLVFLATRRPAISVAYPEENIDVA